MSGQICGSNLQWVFTLGDGCWLPKKDNIEFWVGFSFSLLDGGWSRVALGLPYRDLWALLGFSGPKMPQKSRKVSKMSSGASGHGPPPWDPKESAKGLGTVWEVSGESPGSVWSVFFNAVFGTFRRPAFPVPGRHFRDFFGISGPGGPKRPL